MDYIKPTEAEELKENLDNILEEEDYDSSEQEEAWKDELEEIEKDEEMFKDIEWDEEDEEFPLEANKPYSMDEVKEALKVDDEDDGPPWYDEDFEDLLDKATKKKNIEKRDSFLDDKNLEDG